MKHYLKFIFLLALFLATNSFAQEPNYVRVAIIQDASFVRLKIKGHFEVRGNQGGNVIYKGNDINTTVATYKNGILLGDVRSEADKLFIKCEEAQGVFINGRMFRGNVQFIKNSDSKLLVINNIELQDYVKGILYNEISHYWPIEAMKAQAIVSRTYVLYQMQESKAKNYDVTNDIYSQVYGGQFSERYRTNKAVDDTLGKVLFYKGKVFPAYFHATCAGSTEDAALLWNIDLAPLKGVPCTFCKESPHYNWQGDFPLKEIEEKLTKGGFKVKNISNITVDGLDKSGRVMNLKIISIDNEVKILAKDFRRIIGPNFIKSTNFTVSVVGQDAVFSGFGWGHGAGLCQWGAYFMAKKGDSAEKILKHYYPGSYVKTL